MARVAVKIENRIATVTLTRSAKRNAMDRQMMEEIVAAGEGLFGADIRAVLLAGDGAAFCAGLDVASFAGLAAADPEALLLPRTHGSGNLFQEVAMIWRRLPVPVVAALQGPVFGAGFQLALGADIRIAGEDARLAVMEMKWGLVPDMGGMALLPRLTRSDVIRLLTYSAGPVGAEQALAWGLVTEVVPDPLARAAELAAEIARQSPSAIRAAKALIAAAESGAGEDAVLLAESRAQAGLIGGAHQREVIAANMAGRVPDFDGGD